MITPAEIGQKAARLYPRAIAAWLGGDADFYPRRIPANLRFPKDSPQPVIIRWVNALRDGSKDNLGYGYTVHYEQINNRAHGNNHFPCAIEFDSLDDLLRLLRKQSEFEQLRAAVGKVRERLPQLEGWLAANWSKLLQLASELDDLILVVEYLRNQPRPNCYPRELPLPVSTKLIERNRVVLREWLDLVLAPESIDFGRAPRDFEARYGFRYPRTHYLVRLLDPALLEKLQFPSEELSLPADAIDRLPARDLHVFFVENKINLLTLPMTSRGIAFGGMGNNLSEFQKIQWLRDQAVYYWGDLDLDGLTILARFRHAFPHAKSFLMDIDSLLAHRQLWTLHNWERVLEEPRELLPAELEAFRYCRAHGIRLEQEHIPQAVVNRQIASLVTHR